MDREPAAVLAESKQQREACLLLLLWVEGADSEALNPSPVQPSPGYREKQQHID